MKCPNCGAELAPNVAFCRECGARIEGAKRYCCKCGSELADDVNYCSYCGHKIGVMPAAVVEETKTLSSSHEKKGNKDKVGKANADEPHSFSEKVKDKGSEIWSKLSLYGKVASVSVFAFVFLCFVALLTEKTVAVVIAIVQIVMAIVSILMHKGVIKLNQKKLWHKWLVLTVAILFTFLNVMSYSWKPMTQTPEQDLSSADQNSGDTAELITWENISLSKILPEPQSGRIELLYNGDDWLSIAVHDITENDFLEYVRRCREEYGFTVDSDSLSNYFYACNQEGYSIVLSYAQTSKGLNIDLSSPAQEDTTNPNSSTETQQLNQAEIPEETETPEKNRVPLSITKGTQYAYMTDAWNVYIATAISDDIIKIENWDKTSSSDKTVEHDYDVGAFKINDSENGFAWVDDEHTSFVLTFADKNNSSFKKGGTATFTINISDTNKNKGSNYSEDIACYSYQNDDWHLYRAIPLTEKLIKIETWYRGSSAGTFLFGYDLCLIDTTSGDTDFEWTDDEHTSFSITMRDEENKYDWKEETFVVFILENEDYTHSDVKSYLGKWEVGDGEAAVPATVYNYKYKNYQNVQTDLENAGFTNIKTEILYDIVWGWTAEGEVKSVSIDGRTDYKKGEVFKVDAPIVITYHMKVENNPNKPVENDLQEIIPTDTASSPDDSVNLLAKHYEEVKKQFEDAGFTNIICVEQEGYCDDTDEPEGNVVNISVGEDGQIRAFEKGEQWSKDIMIRIEYCVKPAEEVKPDTTQIVLPQENSKLWKDFDSKGKSTVYYINTDNLVNKPSTTTWGSATVTDGVAEYLDYLKILGFTVTVTDTTHKEPYSGYHTYETNFKVTNDSVTWSMYLYIQKEQFVEYELDIHLS